VELVVESDYDSMLPRRGPHPTLSNSQTLPDITVQLPPVIEVKGRKCDLSDQQVSGPPPAGSASCTDSPEKSKVGSELGRTRVCCHLPNVGLAGDHFTKAVRLVIGTDHRYIAIKCI